MMMPRMLRPHDVAEILGVSYEAALAFIKYSEIDFVRVGRCYRVAEDKLEAFLRQEGQVFVELKKDIY